jgi:hypothetical protein
VVLDERFEAAVLMHLRHHGVAALLEPELVYGHQRGRRLLTRARLALAAEDRDKTLASLLEIEKISRKAPKSAVRRQASALLRHLPATWQDHRHALLAARLPAPL